MNFRQSFLSILSVLFVGCASNTIEKPSQLTEYQQPFAHTQYQAKSATLTQQVLKNESDVVVIVTEPEYVFWSSAEHSLIQQHHRLKDASINAGPQVPTEANPPVKKISVQSEKNDSSIVTVFCDLDKSVPCGKLELCSNEPCKKELTKFYQCSTDGCLPHYIVNNDQSCSEAYAQINPNCTGKGETMCADHPELDFCNVKTE